jgi:hypothetical protein
VCVEGLIEIYSKQYVQVGVPNMKQALSICFLQELEDENRVAGSDGEGLKKVWTIPCSNLKTHPHSTT